MTSRVFHLHGPEGTGQALELKGREEWALSHLIAAGERAFRTTARMDRPRGLFCGMGICYDCLVTIDGQVDQRACVTLARDGMIVEASAGPP